MTLVKEYTTRYIEKGLDILPAMPSIAESWNEQRQGQYLVGL